MANAPAGALLREAREQAALSQRDLAESAGTSQSVVGRIEAGIASPSVDTLSRLVEAAGFELRLSLEPRPGVDPLIEALKRDIDRARLEENLRASIDKRLRGNGDGRG